MMPYRTKRRIAVVVLAGLALWPVIYPFVVAAIGVSPWKGGGWAMYCVPAPVIHVQIIPAGPAEKDPRFGPALATAFQRFENRRMHASWATPDEMGALALRAYPLSPEVVLVVKELRLNPQTARLECTRTTRHTYDSGVR
jgi:hypothetical protein